MASIRKPFQGVWNIIRFNWHFYLLAIASLLLINYLYNYLQDSWHIYLEILFVGIIVTTLISLIVSCYVYDFSDLYKLNWLDNIKTSVKPKIVNINAGFDETSFLLRKKFRNSELIVFDFYNPKKHTEVSIKRARKAYPLYPGTIHVSATFFPLEDNSIDLAFVILAAHEIRDFEERILFFTDLALSIKPLGKIIVTEHLRDLPNCLAYNIGCLHFYSKKTWLQTFEAAGLYVVKEIKITPFISTFILKKHGAAS